MAKISNSLKEAAHLTELLLKKKEKRGGLHLRKNGLVAFMSQNSLLDIDSQGEPIDFIENKSFFSHQIIEELMISANTQVALYLLKKQLPSILRIHEPPGKEDLKELCEQLLQLGLPLKELKKAFNGKEIDMRSFQELLSRHKNQSLAYILFLRCMKKAIYSTNAEKGHFGLALSAYTHFTSPIRRYTDLIIHRILKSTLISQKSPYTDTKLQNIAQHLSECEKKAVQAERLFRFH